MAFTYASLANGQLPNSKTTLYTSVAETAVKQISLVAVGAAVTVNIYFKASGGTSRRIIPQATAMDSAGADTVASQIECLENTMEMEAGDVIEGDASAATSVDYVISGATR